MNQIETVKIKFWKKFLKLRESSFMKSIENCETAIELIKKNNMDLTPESIYLFLILIKEV